MLTVTEPARERLLTKLDRKNAAGDECMRVTRREGGWRLVVARAQPDDTIVEHQGRPVLVMDATVSESISSMVLDVDQTTRGPRLKLEPASEMM